MSDSHLRESEIVDVENLVVGFGYSAIPLLREFDLRGQPYTIISAGPSIWEQLEAADRLCFDLVSSFHSSFYSFAQVNRDVEEDYYPTAREFYEHHLELFAPYRDRIVHDKVVHVDNYDDYSLVQTASGRSYRARNLVFATGLGRPQNETIKELDVREIEGKTVVLGTMGDTANMMVARLLPQDNRVIVLHNGFQALDKTVFFEMPGPKTGWYIPLFGIRTGRRYSLDLAQYEAHQVGYFFPRLYKHMFLLVQGMPEPTSWFGRTVMPHAFTTLHPETWRPEVLRDSWAAPAPVRNGLIALKHWPIDMYKNRFEDELEEAIDSGRLMNDIAFFHTEGLVESWPKEQCSVDVNNKTVSCGGEVVHFDHYIAGGYEQPRLPDIVRNYADGRRHRHAYNYMRDYLGIVPSELRNVYFVGYTRPYTGGLANIVEMQSLLVHKMISDASYRASIYANIHDRIERYNAYHYPYKHLRAATDHVVHFGHYTGELARQIGIDRKLGDAWSWRPLQTYLNLRFELLHPNNPIKFRMKGEYAVDGAEQLCRKIAARNDHWAIMMFLFLSSLWDKLGAAMLLILAYLGAGLQPFLASSVSASNFAASTALFIALAIGLYRKAHLLNVITYSTPLPLLGPKANLQPLALGYIAYTGDWRACLLMFAATSGLAFFSRQFHLPPISGRYLFGDCKYKHRYRGFWEEYQAAYKRVHARRRAASTSDSA